MLSFTLEGDPVRGFMNSLLREDWFDAFEVRSVELTALTRVDISGELTPARTNGGEPDAAPGAYATWAQLKPQVLALVKNGGPPRALRAVFSAAAGLAAAMHPNARACFLNMTYENGRVGFTAGTSQKQFSLDKALNESWEAHVAGLFARWNVPVKINENK